MTKIKVAHILHSVGGVDVSLRLILKNSSDNFEHIVIHGKKDTSVDFLDNRNNKIESHKISVYRDISLFDDFKALFQTYKLLKKIKPDIIHAHSSKGGLIARALGRILNIQTLYTPQAFSFLSTQNKWKRQLYITIEKALNYKKSYILASSNSEKSRAINEVGYKEHKVLVFNNCINVVKEIEPFSIEKTWPDNYICTVGRPSYQKNIELMIQVFLELRKTQEMHLVVMGVGHHVGQLESVKSLIKKHGLQNEVSLLDWTSRDDVFNIIKGSKLYLSTARYEGLPYSVIEALALSKPCVVSDCDGNKDLIENDYNGYVINNNCVTNYVEKINKLLNDADLLKEFSENALISFNQNYDIKKNIFNLEKIYIEYSIKQGVF